MGKPTIWFPNGSDINQAVQSQKQARSLKFRIKEEDEVYYPSSKNKDALICVFVFAYANFWFSHEMVSYFLITLILDKHPRGIVGHRYF